MAKTRTACLIAVPRGLAITVSGLTGGTLADGAQSQTTTASGKTHAMPTEVTYPQVYVAPDGGTRFREVKVPLTLVNNAPPSPPSAQSALVPATTIRHAAYPPNWGASDRDRGVFHNASSARFITVRSGVARIRTSDGDTRRFQRGDVLEVLDVAPSKGHITWVGAEGAVLLFSNHPQRAGIRRGVTFLECHWIPV